MSACQEAKDAATLAPRHATQLSDADPVAAALDLNTALPPALSSDSSLAKLPLSYGCLQRQGWRRRLLGSTMRQLPLFFVLLATSLPAACADAGDDDKQLPLLPSSSSNVEAAADAILYRVLEFDSAVYGAVARTKNELEGNQFALFDEINRSIGEGTVPETHIAQGAADELLEQMQMTTKDDLTVQTYALLSRFAEIFGLPRESISERRLALYLDDSIKVSSEMEVFLMWPSEHAPKENAYYFAPAYNFVMCTHIFALAAAGYVKTSIESTVRDALQTNQFLVGGGDADKPGYLSEWITAHTSGSASTAKKLDQDPILYSIRRAIDEQQRALE